MNPAVNRDRQVEIVATLGPAASDRRVIAAVRGATSPNIGTREEPIALVAGVPFNRSGTSNILRVAPLDEQAVFEGETAD